MHSEAIFAKISAIRGSFSATVGKAMPTVRKLSTEEVERITRRRLRFPRLPAPPPEDLPLRAYNTGEEENDASWGDQAAYVTMRARPRVGDIVRIGAGDETGIVLATRERTGGGWSAVEALIDEGRYLVPAPAVGPVLGRPRGVTRMDHPRRRTHGWFVRVGYAGMGKQARHTRLFSDMSYGGIAAALRAALHYRVAAECGR
jgi:hypothetical protein